MRYFLVALRYALVLVGMAAVVFVVGVLGVAFMAWGT